MIHNQTSKQQTPCIPTQSPNCRAFPCQQHGRGSVIERSSGHTAFVFLRRITCNAFRKSDGAIHLSLQQAFKLTR